MNFRKKKIITVTMAMILVCGNLYAHNGKTDSNGGHKDSKNVSGLGTYHYHCGEHPAHLHENGLCPYETQKTINETTSVSASQPKYVERNVGFNIDNQLIEISGITVNNTNLVELRGICDSLGITILSYDAEMKSIECQKGDIKFLLQIESKDMWIGTELVTLEVAPVVYNGKTMVPARAIAEAIGMAVTYDANTNSIVIK